jgi:hypothetical protein
MARPAAAKAPEFRPKDHPATEELRQELVRALVRRDRLIADVRSALDDIDGGGGAPTGAPYTTYAASGALTAERVWVNGTNTTINTAVAGQIAVDAAGGLTVEQVEDLVAAMVQDVPTIAWTYIDGSSELEANVVAGSIGTTQLTDDGVTFAKLQNIATDRILGRDTAGSGNVEELTPVAPFRIGGAVGAGNFGFDEFDAESWWANPTGGDAVPVQVTPGPGLAWVGTTLEVVNGSIERTLYEVNYATLANNTLVDGAETIDGLAHVAANMGELGTAAVQNGTGIRLVAAANNGGAVTMTAASQLIPYIYTTLGDIPGYDPTGTYIFEIYCPARILEANGEYVGFGLWGVANSPSTGSAARMRAAKLVRNAADTADVMRVTNDGTDGTGTVDISTHNVFGFKIDGTGAGQIFSGIWSAGWPTSYTAHSFFTPISTVVSPMNTADVRIFMGLGCANDASPSTSVTIERSRIRRVF